MPIKKLWFFVNSLFLLIALFFHIYKLEELPRGLYIDESSIGLNAALIAQKGVDEFGESFPLFFRAFGEYKNPLYIYTTALIFKLAGVSVFNLRLTSFVFFAIALILFYVLLTKLFPKRPVIHTLGILAFGFLPQYFLVSRVSFEVISLAAVTLLFLLFVFLAFEGSRSDKWPYIYAVLAGISLGLSVYAYTTSRLLLFVILPALGVAYFARKNFVKIGIVAVSALIILIPYFLYFSSRSENLTVRFKDLTYLYKEDLTVVEKAGTFVENYFSYLSPYYLAVVGDPNLRHHTGTSGIVFKSVFLLSALGLLLVFLAGGPNKRFWLFITFGVFISPLGAALTYDKFHSLRSFMLGIFLVLLAVYAFSVISRVRIFALRVSTVVLIFLALMVEIVAYQVDFLTLYPQKSVSAFGSYGLEESIRYSISRGAQETVLTTGGIHIGFYQLVYGISGTKIVSGPAYVKSGSCVVYAKDSGEALALARLERELGFYGDYLSVPEWLVAVSCYK